MANNATENWTFSQLCSACPLIPRFLSCGISLALDLTLDRTNFVLISSLQRGGTKAIIGLWRLSSGLHSEIKTLSNSRHLVTLDLVQREIRNKSFARKCIFFGVGFPSLAILNWSVDFELPLLSIICYWNQSTCCTIIKKRQNKAFVNLRLNWKDKTWRTSGGFKNFIPYLFARLSLRARWRVTVPLLMFLKMEIASLKKEILFYKLHL